MVASISVANSRACSSVAKNVLCSSSSTNVHSRRPTPYCCPIHNSRMVTSSVGWSFRPRSFLLRGHIRIDQKQFPRCAVESNTNLFEQVEADALRPARVELPERRISNACIFRQAVHSNAPLFEQFSQIDFNHPYIHITAIKKVE